MAEKDLKHLPDKTSQPPEGKCPADGGLSDRPDSSVSYTEYPGDGVCPSVAQFNEVVTAIYNTWNSASSKVEQHQPIDLFCVDSFLELLQGIPAFNVPPLEKLCVLSSDDATLEVECALQWETTNHHECDQSQKTSKFYQILGFSFPTPYSFMDVNQQTELQYPGLATDRLSQLACLVLSWSYILSCRWVEILKSAGEKAQLRHSPGYNLDRFWDLILEDQWDAVFFRNGKFFCAPWVLQQEGEDEAQVERVKRRKVQPNSSLAFNVLANYCDTQNLANECAVALAMTLMIMSGVTGYEVQLPPPVKPSKPPIMNRDRKDKLYDRLFDSIDKCISLSCVDDGIASLLYSCFFDPSIPCTFVGAQWVGIQKALGSVEEDPARLARAIAARSPKCSLLWLAAIWCGRASEIYHDAVVPMPTTELLVASWTNTMQSFLQVKYCNTNDRRDLIPRAWEFSTSYFARPGVIKPWTRAPPFGSTILSNLSLEVRAHLDHDHRPLTLTWYWKLQSGEMLLASQPMSLPFTEVCLLQPSGAEQIESHIDDDTQHKADNKSNNATSNLFFWHKNNEEGLWLDDGTQSDIEVLRKLVSHPWIDISFGDHEQGEDEAHSDSEKRAPNEESMKVWLDGIETPMDDDATDFTATKKAQEGLAQDLS